MRERLGGLRLRLALAISAVSLVVVAVTFVALRQGTDADLRERIDRELAQRYADFRASVLAPAPRSQPALLRRSRRFVAAERFHPKAQVLAIEAGGRLVTNERALTEPAAEGAEGEELGESSFLEAPPGLSTVSVDEAGRLRVLTEPVVAGGRTLGTFRAGEPLRSIEEARSGLDDAFVLAGAVALAVSLIAAAGIATLLTRPLRRMAAVAVAVDAGELGHRIGPLGRHDEVGALGESFDHMLDRLQDAFRRQEQFVSDASHELRTPLTVLRGQVELLEGEHDEEVRRRSAESVIRELDHMSRIVDDLLTLAQAEGGELVRPRVVDLTDFVDDLRRDLPLLGSRRHVVEGTAAGTLRADPERLNQVVRNIVRNAVAAGGPEGLLTIRTRAEGDRLEFEVSDDGPGIPDADLERVFDRFHRAAGGPAGAGTGLGLAIARAIVEAHGGTIRAEVRPGGGTTIRFELPGYAAPAD
jgi:signal transduction histidine kinase